MSLNLARAVTARSVASCLVGLFVLAGCSNPGQPALARPQPQGHARQSLSSGYAGTASFDVPVVNPSTWQGAPIGTGTWSTSATPPLSGGPSGVGFYDTQNGVTGHYLMIGNLSAPSGNFFGIVSDGAPLALGTTAINNSTLYAGIFDAATGDAVALASSGSITLTAAGLIGGRITGSFTGTLDDVTSTPMCTSSAQCLPAEACVGGRCVPSGCTSTAQCATGQVCQGGTCVTPGCTSNAQCGAGRVCQAGTCVTVPACTSNAQCAGGQICQSGQCVTAPGCTSNAQCGAGRVCQAGTCVTQVSPCDGMQGDGAYSGTLGNVAVCSAFSGSVNATKALAEIGRDSSGGLSLYVLDPLQDSAGAILPLVSCPSGPGTVSVSNGSFWDQTTSGGVTFYAVRPASAASVTYTVVGASLKGSFWMQVAGGGQVKGSFDVH